MDTQFLWNGFYGLNRHNGHDSVPLRVLIVFLSKHPKQKRAFAARPVPELAVALLARPIGLNERRVIKMARPAPFENRHFRQSDLQRRISSDAYEARVSALMERCQANWFAAELVVHGEAVRRGEIRA